MPKTTPLNMKKATLFFVIITVLPKCILAPESNIFFDSQALPTVKLNKNSVASFFDIQTFFQRLMQNDLEPEQACLLLLKMIEENKIQLYSSESNNQIQCPICLEENPSVAIKLNCHKAHIYCARCMPNIAKIGSCVLCKNELSPKSCLIKANNLLNFLKLHKNSDFKTNPEALIEPLDCDLKLFVNLENLKMSINTIKLIQQNKDCSILQNHLKTKFIENAEIFAQNFIDIATSKIGITLILAIILTANIGCLHQAFEMLCFSLWYLGYL